MIEITTLFSQSDSISAKKPINLEEAIATRKSFKMIKSKKDIKATVFEAVNQFFGKSQKACWTRSLKHTDLTMLTSICNSLVDSEADFNRRLVLLVYVFIVETCINHSILLNGFVELQRYVTHCEFRKSAGSHADAPMFKFDTLKSFYPVSQEDIKSLYEWLGRQYLCSRQVNTDTTFVEYVPSLVLPSFNQVKLLSDKQRQLVKTFMVIAAKRMHQSRLFMTHNKTKNFMEYSDFITDYQNRFRYLAINKKSESQFNFSCSHSERFKADEVLEIQESPGPLNLRMNSFNEKVSNRPRFKSDTLRYGLQPIPISVKKISNKITSIHMQRESSKELIAEPQVCSYCQTQVNGLIWICSKCFHGGHLSHMNKWFADNSNCAKCFNCKCRE